MGGSYSTGKDGLSIVNKDEVSMHLFKNKPHRIPKITDITQSVTDQQYTNSLSNKLNNSSKEKSEELEYLRNLIDINSISIGNTDIDNFMITDFGRKLTEQDKGIKKGKQQYFQNVNTQLIKESEIKSYNKFNYYLLIVVIILSMIMISIASLFIKHKYYR